jgi:FAD/FMN-containing dehydrogenase/Fe-S oxidoreductase
MVSERRARSGISLQPLADRLQGDLVTDDVARTIYATDASEYQERPLAVAFPKTDADVGEIVRFAATHRLGLIPRAAGTSLAGQVVGNGIVVDLGRHLNRILSLDVDRRRVRVQPGVVRNELNRFLAPHGLFFGPETSTAGWAMIGGMVGNNSCGSNSIAYGTTRDHLISARGFLADGSEATFGPLDAASFRSACAAGGSLETTIYRELHTILSDAATRQLIRDSFPRREVTRRNTGYALDTLMDASCFDPESTADFNACRLLAGSEGTLFMGVEFELSLIPPPPPGALLCIHCDTVDEALRATVIVMRDLTGRGIRPTGCELIDKKILDCTRDNLKQTRNRAFVVGDPGAVLVVELRDSDHDRVSDDLDTVEAALRAAGLGYAYPRLVGAEGDRVWELRRAGQGLVNNLPGDAKPREIVEDTAVAVEDLPAYIAEFDRLLTEKYGIDCVHYAHAGAGELHLRPLFNLHSPEGLRMFRDVATDVAHLVKKYRGSLSGEHGDGRLRGEFIRTMVGDECYRLLEQVKRIFDPDGIFNPGKIVETPPMDTSLRIAPAAHPLAARDTVFRFADSGGILRAAEKCTGVGQCRKTHLIGGTMCPSYMATRDEQHTTRARANVLRQALADPVAADPWTQPALAEVMDLCLSCKACKSECPSNVDMARLKAEWEQQRQEREGIPLRSRLIAGSAAALRRAAIAPWIYNLAVTAPGISYLLKRVMGFAARRSLPALPGTTLTAWWRRRGGSRPSAPLGRVHLFCDEFTDTLDVPVGIATVELLEGLGFEVVIPRHVDSGRAHFSKGLVRAARDLAIRNVELLAPLITDDAPLIGIEPSAILGFRDEYLDIVPEPLVATARSLAGQTLLLEEFLAREVSRGRIQPAQFTAEPRQVFLHGHCHQKALSSLEPAVTALSLPANYSVQVIPSGCCGMAGSFGYEAEHYELSMQIGELVLLPAVRAAGPDAIIAAAGTSCRHQIKDGAGRIAWHPAEILRAALVSRHASG